MRIEGLRSGNGIIFQQSLWSGDKLKLRCCAMSRRKELTWSDDNKTEVKSNKRTRRIKFEELIQREKDAVMTYEDVCDGVACYQIQVYPKIEELVAESLKRKIKELPPLTTSQGVQKKRFVSTWVPSKQLVFQTKGNSKGVRRRVKYGPFSGEIVFLECQMDKHAFDVIQNHPYVQRFSTTHPLNKQIPLPCTDAEKQEPQDWLWLLTEPEAKLYEYKRQESATTTEALGEDIVFAVDKLMNPHADDIVGVNTVYNPNKESADELGERYKQKQQRQHRQQRRARSERRFSKSRWNSPNVAKQQQLSESVADSELTRWFEDDDMDSTNTDSEITSKASFDSGTTGKSLEEKGVKKKTPNQTADRLVKITKGPFADYQGLLLEERQGEYTIKVDVFGEEAKITLKGDEFIFYDN